MKELIRSLFNDKDITVSLKAIGAVLGMLLVIPVVVVPLANGKPCDVPVLLALFGFITAMVGLSLPGFNKPM